jgi:hypothetical protein
MLLYCPMCQASFAGASRCPRCDGLLSMPSDTAAGPRAAVEEWGFDRPGPGNRIAVGTVLALGLYLGLRKVVAAALAASGPAAPWWLTLDGLAAVYALQTAAVAFGGLVAAAGRHSGFPFGLAVGGVCGSLFLAAEALSGAPVLQPLFLLQPPILAVAAGLAGSAGARVWAPVPELDIRPLVKNKLSSVTLGMEPTKERDRPTQLARLLLGAVIMAVGFTFADDARHFLQKHSGGLLQTETIGQGKFLSWQLAVAVVVVGGAVAGAGTGAGVWHGTLAGIVGAGGVVGLTVLRGGTMSPQAEFQLNQLAMGSVSPLEPLAIAGVTGLIMLLGVLGGWLGAQLYLPLAAEHLRGRRLKMTD